MSTQGGFNFLGPNWDMKGPMLYTMRVDYFNDKTAEQVIAAIESVLDDVRKNGITAQELAQAKTTIRSTFLDDMETGGMPLFGRANLLGVFALFDDDRRRTVAESLCVLYVAMTRAIHCLHMILAPPKSGEKSLPKTYAGLLRATLGKGLASTAGVVYEHGDSRWCERSGERPQSSSEASANDSPAASPPSSSPRSPPR